MKNSKKIGIWGYGIFGRSAVNYFNQLGYQLAVVDKSRQHPDIKELEQKNIPFDSESQLNEFLENHDLILPSPGIDLRPYEQYKSKWLSQLDIFYSQWQKPIIAITGSIGKTTVTHLLTLLLTHAGKTVAMGGHIGIPVFELLYAKSAKELAVVEVSSFQL